MQDKLIIYLCSSDPEQVEWATGSYAHCGEVDQLADVAKGREVIVVVPAEAVLLTIADLPKMSRSRMLQALPFALEEQLIDDVEALHFAVGQPLSDHRLPVAIVAHEKIQSWLTLLNSWGVTPDYLLSAVYMLPVEEGHCHVMIDHAMATVRQALCQGFGCDRYNLLTLLPEPMTVRNYTKKSIKDALDVTVPIEEIMLEPHQLLVDMTDQGVQKPFIDLLQNEYAVKKSTMPQWQPGRKLAFALGLTWIVMLFLNPLVSSFLLRHHLSQVNQQVAVIYRRYFPEATRVVAPKERLQARWQQLSGQVAANDALVQLSVIGNAIKQVPGVVMKRFDYQGAETTIELTAASPDDLSAFTTYLSGHGLAIKQQNANLTGGRINAVIQIATA